MKIKEYNVWDIITNEYSSFIILAKKESTWGNHKYIYLIPNLNLYDDEWDLVWKYCNEFNN